MRCFSSYDPWMIALRDGDGRLVAAAPLARRRRRGLTEVVALGAGPSDQIRLPARDAAAAEALADAVAGELRTLHGPWRLTLRHLPTDDPVARALAARLRHSFLLDGDVSPALRVGPDRRLQAHVSKNHRQQVRRMTNRMRKAGLTASFAHLRDPREVAAVLPQVEDVCRRRDAALNRRSYLDDEEAGPFFRAVILALAKQGEVQLTTLRLNDRLAAYVLCFLDGRAYRMWNCRFDPDLGHFGPGRVANNEALACALADPDCDEFDWMRGEEEYKSSMSNVAVRAQDLRAFSSPAVQLLADGPRRLKTVVKGVLQRHERLAPVRTWLDAARATVRRRWP